MDNHNMEKYFQFNSSTHRQDDNYMALDKKNEVESDIQAQAQNRKDMEAKHMIAKELILGHEQYEKLDNSNGLRVPEVEPLLQNKSQALQPLQKYADPEKLDLFLLKINVFAKLGQKP